MLIKRLRIEGYRSLKSIDWAPGRLNVLIGPNCSGKSNLLKAVDLLSEMARGRCKYSINKEGGMGAIVWDGETAGQLYFGIHLSYPSLTKPNDSKKNIVNYELTLQRAGSSGGYIITQDQFGRYSEIKRGVFTEPELLVSRSQIHTTEVPDEETGHTIQLDLINNDEPILSQSRVVGLIEDEWLLFKFSELLSNWRVYRHFRVEEHSPIRSDIIAGAEQWVIPGGHNLVKVLHTLYSATRQFREDFDDSMKAAFGQEYEEVLFPPTAETRIQMQVRWRSLQQPQAAASLSDGTLRYMYLMAILLNPAPPPLVCIDEPEIGLHPSMFPLVAEAAMQAAEKTQVILTTHSPEFLSCFTEYEAEQGGVVSVMYLKDGASHIKRLQGEPLSRWIKSYKLGRFMMSGELNELAMDAGQDRGQ